uniref:Nucleoporin Nup133/Nup155-like N-terminal domain-containing protein n=3 Tax=Parascaris univalens TaxID=6257 RepID=A0A915BIY4_PARUN
SRYYRRKVTATAMLDEVLLLESVENDYPSLVREALSINSDVEFHHCASLSETNYVSFIIGRALFIWKLNDEKSTINVPFVLTLPPSGLPYTIRTIRIYKKSNSSTVGVIAISPEGTIRHWPNISRNYIDSSIDLEREVALSLDVITKSEEVMFLLSTTTCSFFLLSLDTGRAPTPGKRQKMAYGIISKPLYTNASRSIGKRVSSVLFGDTGKHGSRLLKAIVIEMISREECDTDDVDEFSEERLRDVYILALKSKTLQLYSIDSPSKAWSFDPTQLAVEHFANLVWNLHNIPEQSKWRQEMKVWLVDCVRIRAGIVILMAAANTAVSTQIHFALGFLPIRGVKEATEDFEWFSLLKLPTNETFRVSESTEEDSLMGLTLHLPLESQQCSHERIEGLLLVSRHFAYSIRLPDSLQGNAEVGSVHAASFLDDTLIGSACDTRFCYVLLKERGINRIRLLPRGFDANLARSVLAVQAMSTSNGDTASNVDRDLLAEAFLLFAKGDLPRSHNRVEDLLGVRRTSVAQLCINYALDIVDDIPNDERWHAVGVQTRRKSPLTESSFLLKVHLDEQKRKVLAMFILFLKYMGLDAKLDVTVHSQLSDSRSGCSQMAELTEKVDIAIGLYAWCEKHSVAYIDAAINRVLRNRKEIINDDLLTPYDYFFYRLSRIDELLDALLVEEEEALSASTELNEKLVCIEQVGTAFVIFAEAIEQRRANSLIKTGDHFRWTQQRSIFSPIVKHLDIIFDYLSPHIENNTRGSQLRLHAISLSSIVLEEQPPNERLGSPIIAKFIAVGEKAVGIDLAKKFHDYRTLIELTEELPEDERRSQIEHYKDYFRTADFHRVLLEYYMEKGQLKNLLEEDGPQAEEFFSSNDTVKWIRELHKRQFDMASYSLKSLAQRRGDDVIVKKHLLSFAKLAALCADERDTELLDEIKGGLRLIAHQEDTPNDILKKVDAVSSKSGIMRSLTAEQIITANVNDRRCDCDCHFRALLTLSSVLDEPACSSHNDLIKSLKAKIWLSAVKADSSLWKQIRTRSDEHKQTIYYELLNRLVESDLNDARKMQLLPNIEELIGCMTELSTNQRFAFIVRSEEEAARRQIPEVTKQRKEQLSGEIEFARARGFNY